MKYKLHSFFKLSVTLVCTSLFCLTAKSELLGPALQHPYLIDNSAYPIIHFDNGQSDRSDTDVWLGDLTVDPADIHFAPTGVGNIGMVHRRYPNGDDVVFISGPSHVGKYRLTPEGPFELIDEITIPGFEKHYATPNEIGSLVKDLDAFDDDEPAIIERLQAVLKEKDITLHSYASGVYTMMDNKGAYFAGYETQLFKFEDVVKNDASSAIRVVASRDIKMDVPAKYREQITRFVGMNLTWDGHVAIALAGVVAVVDRDLQNVSLALIEGEVVDNSIATDDADGIYLVTDKYMRKMVWTGSELSTDEADGAWKETYDWVKKPTSLSRGSGTTPVLMGYGESSDRLVLISDQGDPVKLVAFWRDAIPSDAKLVEGATSKRTAGSIELTIPIKSTVEWSPHVSKHGVMVFASDFLNPVRWDAGFDLVSTCITSGLTRPAPHGAEKFEWNQEANQFERSWSYLEKSFTWSLAPVSDKTGTVHLVTIEDGVYGLTGLDWETGEQVAEITLGKSVKLNTCGAFIVPLPDESLYLTSVFGGVRIMKPQSEN